MADANKVEKPLRIFCLGLQCGFHFGVADKTVAAFHFDRGNLILFSFSYSV